MRRKTEKKGSFRWLRSEGSELISPLSRSAKWVAATMAISAVAAVGLSALEGRVLTGQTARGAVEMHPRIAHKPDWMPESLATEIASTLIPPGARYYEKDLTDKVRRRAESNPYVRRVHRVVKALSDRPGVGIIELHAEFRMPLVKAKLPRGHTYLDSEGYPLPGEHVPQWVAFCPEDPSPGRFYHDRAEIPPGTEASQVHYITITGAQLPPRDTAERWTGDDIAAGLRLAKLVATRDYAYQISNIDVSNFAGRIDPNAPHLRMWAQLGRSRATEIRFGRFPHPEGDYVVSPERKMSYLDEYAASNNGHLAGINTYLDLRYDELHVSRD